MTYFGISIDKMIEIYEKLWAQKYDIRCFYLTNDI